MSGPQLDIDSIEADWARQQSKGEQPWRSIADQVRDAGLLDAVGPLCREVRQLRQALAAVREVLDAAEVYSAEAPYSDAMWQLRSEVLAALAAAVEGNPE